MNWRELSKFLQRFFSSRLWLFLPQRKCTEFASHLEVSLEGSVSASCLGVSVVLAPGSGGHSISEARGDTSKSG